MTKPARESLKPINFTIDAAIIQELGERLIGQPHIALAELIKNSYDADANTCQVTFGDGAIEIADNGHGMSPTEFRDYWMRVGTTHKVDDEESSELKRPLTGSKGVGRLAVQFLGNDMTIETVAKKGSQTGLYAYADWKKITRGSDLESVEVLWDERRPTTLFPGESKHGTRITIRGLKDQWGVEKLVALGQALWTLRSPFRKREKMNRAKTPEDFDISVVAPAVENAQQAFDSTLETLFQNWKARIRGRVENGRQKGKATITVEFKDGYPAGEKAESFRHSLTIPIQTDSGRVDSPCLNNVSFEILVFKLEGRQPGGARVDDVRGYLEKHGNVRIYDTGFRLPYYGMESDWLNIAADQAKRLSVSQLLPKSLGAAGRYMLDLPDSRRLFGAVEINTPEERAQATRDRAPPGEILQLQAGRDRLHTNDAFFQLRDVVRFSLDFYANRYQLREARRIVSDADKERASSKQERALRILDANREKIPATVFREVKNEVAAALKTTFKEEQDLDRRAALLAPLASAGMAAVALNHEFARERQILRRVVSELRSLSKRLKIPELADLAEEVANADARIQSLQGMFSPLVSEHDKLGAERLRVKPVIENTLRSMETLLPGIEFSLRAVPSDLRFPLGSLAEWNALIQNVLTNAWDAMLSSKVRRVSFSGGVGPRSREFLRVSDTGVGLGLPASEADLLFNPFERKLKIKPDQESIALGGQGLGLAIVKMIATRRNASARFVEPEEDFATTFELSWRG